jgi:peptide/nickel transport system substrate-binding protein
VTRGVLLKRAAAGSAVLTAGGLLVACGSSGSDGSSTSASGTAGAGAPKRGGVLRVGAAGGGSTDTLDPHHTQAAAPDTARMNNLYDTLTVQTHDGRNELALAESFEPNSAGDEWTVRLRDDVQWHDGKPLAAADLIFTVQRVLDPKRPSTGAGLISFVDPQGMKQLDDRTVRFKLKTPHGPFPRVWADLYLSVVPVGFDPKRPVGTGPFTYRSFTPQRESTFDRNDNYWGEGPWVDQLVVIDFPDDTARLNALIGGQVDAIDSVPYPQAPVIRGNGSLALLESPTLRYLPIIMRTDQPPFDDPRVREAMRLIPDRRGMVDVALDGHGAIANDMIGRFDSCGFPTLPQREQDLEQARALLKQAGQSGLTIELATTPAAAGMAECAQVYAEQAKAAGVTVNVRKLDQNGYLAKYKQWPFAVDFFDGDYLGLASLTLTPDGVYGQTHWNDREFLSLLAKAQATVDDGKRCAIVQDMHRIEYERGGNIVWGWVSNVDAHSSKLQGFTPDGSGQPLSAYRFREVWFA